MNKLEEYKINSAVDCAIRVKNIAHRAGVLVGYDEGFDTAIALDLPVKFSNWKDKYTEKMGGYYYKSRLFDSGLERNKEYTNETLYQYWIDNIYKSE